MCHPFMRFLERHAKSLRFVAQSFGDMVQPPQPRESEADVEVFSHSAKAWLPGRVSLLAAPGKITVCYSHEAKPYAKLKALQQAARRDSICIKSPSNWALYIDWYKNAPTFPWAHDTDTARARRAASISARLHRWFEWRTGSRNLGKRQIQICPFTRLAHCR